MTDTIPFPAVEVVWRTHRIERQESVNLFRGFLIAAALSIPVWAVIGTVIGVAIA